jgi:hypothetical protein
MRNTQLVLSPLKHICADKAARVVSGFRKLFAERDITPSNSLIVPEDLNEDMENPIRQTKLQLLAPLHHVLLPDQPMDTLDKLVSSLPPLALEFGFDIPFVTPGIAFLKPTTVESANKIRLVVDHCTTPASLSTLYELIRSNLRLRVRNTHSQVIIAEGILPMHQYYRYAVVIILPHVLSMYLSNVICYACVCAALTPLQWDSILFLWLLQVDSVTMSSVQIR